MSDTELKRYDTNGQEHWLANDEDLDWHHEALEKAAKILRSK